MKDELKKAFSEFVQSEPMQWHKEKEFIEELAEKHGVDKRELQLLIKDYALSSR